MHHLLALLGLACSSPPVEDAERAATVDTMYEALKALSFAQAPELTWSDRRPADVLVDARSSEERDVSMIPGALTLDDLEGAHALSGQRVLVYCTIGARSGTATLALRDKGYDAYNIRGGILSFAHSGGLFVHAGTPTRRAHTWSRRFDLLPHGYEATW